METNYPWWLVLLVGLVAGCGRAPEELKPTALSAGWPTLTCAEEGFEIKYPPEWELHRSPGVLSLSGGGAGVGIRTLDAETRRQMEALDHSPKPGWFSPRPRPVRIGGRPGTRGSSEVGFFDNVGNETFDVVQIERGPVTYVISWTLGRGSRKAPASFTPVCEEIAATFRCVEVKPAKLLAYSDARSGITFEYPYAWIFNYGGAGDFSANLMKGGALTIRLELKAHTSFAEFRRQQGNQVTGVEDEQELFRHRRRGRRFRWLEHEAYSFENNGGLFIVEIGEHPQLGSVPRKDIDDFLDSLQFQ